MLLEKIAFNKIKTKKSLKYYMQLYFNQKQRDCNKITRRMQKYEYLKFYYQIQASAVLMHITNRVEEKNV